MVLNPTAIDFFELVLLFLVGLVIEAVILQVSCVLFNLLADVWAGPSSRPFRGPAQGAASLAPTPNPQSITTEPGVPKPSFEPALAAADPEALEGVRVPAYAGVPKPRLERAMRIVFVAALVNVVAGFIILRVLRLMGQMGGIVAPGSMPFHLVSSPLYFLVLSAINAAMLPTRFAKSLLITLIFLFLSFLLILALFVCLMIAYSLGLSLDWLP